MRFSRSALVLLFCVLLCGRNAPAQEGDTNALTLCSEAELIDAFTFGGDYVMDCGTNAVLIRLTEPIVVSKRISIFTTNQVVITGSNVTRLFVIQPGGDVTLGGITFFSGRQTETNENNGGVEETAGGAFYINGGKLRILGGRFEGNSAVGITGEDGVDGMGDPGSAGGDAAGGAIYNNGGMLFVSNVVFTGNSVVGGTGGKGANGRTSGFGMSGGNGGDGGSAAGSAIYAKGGTFTNMIFFCTFTNNTATGAAAGAGGAAGGLLGFPGLPGAAGDGVGAAVTGADAKMLVYGSTFAANRVVGANGLDGNAGVGRNDGDQGLTGGDAAGGAIYSTGNLWMTNSTFFRNTATSGKGGNGGAGPADGFGFNGGDGGSGGLATGGAVDSAGPASIIHCTFSDNSVSAGAGGTGGAGGGALGESGDAGSAGTTSGDAIYGSSTTSANIVLANSIVANSRSSLAGKIVDRGGNITTDRNPKVTSPQSFPATNAFLRALAINGGLTWTMAIRSNSVAIDRGIAEHCTPVDQRGTNRVGNCDIGAFEFTLPPTQVLGTNSLRVVISTNDNVVLTWPAGSTVVLQGATNLVGTNTVWTTVTNGITSAAGMNTFILSSDSGLPYAFYRLFDANATHTNTVVFPPNPGGASTSSGAGPSGESGSSTDAPPSLPPLPPVTGTESGSSAGITREEESSDLPLPPVPTAE
jgi:hypothetical protein